MKIYINELGHVTKWLPCPYMEKTLKIFFLKLMTDGFETWYVASVTQVLPRFRYSSSTKIVHLMTLG